ncbi:MAG: hypothetical protein JOZ51_20515 [Chloroflexi bacterium]|nr:hypothetical protein [Chloroflexota bacterium]
MLITVDLAHPENDVEVVGLAEGETVEVRLGPRGYAAYRIFGAAARLLFLSMQDMRKPDIAAATEMMVDRESTFIRQRLDELRRLGGGGSGGSGGEPPPRRDRPSDQRPPDSSNGQGRRRR